MLENETDVISHLLEVESLASTVVDDAQLEASNSVLEAKTKAQKIFQSKYQDIINELENQYIQKSQTYKNQYEAELNSFKLQPIKNEKDTNSFYNFLDTLVFKS